LLQLLLAAAEPDASEASFAFIIGDEEDEHISPKSENYNDKKDGGSMKRT